MEICKRAAFALQTGATMRVLVTGAAGLLGQEMMKELARRNHEAFSIRHRETDITDRNTVLTFVRDAKPDAIIHCAAWTNVDAAEHPDNRTAVYRVNVDGTKNMAEAAKKVCAKLLYLSSDYVFDGAGDKSWIPDEKRFSPLNYYGMTKLEGEKAIAERLDRFFIVRTSWLFGSGGKNFVSAILKAGREHDAVRVVDDQIGTPTYAKDLARLLADMAETEKYGYYHATNSESAPGEYISWYEFTKEIYRQAGLNTKVIPVTTAEYGLSKAVRPHNSRLDKSKLSEAGFTPLPSWEDSLHRYLGEIGEI